MLLIILLCSDSASVIDRVFSAFSRSGKFRHEPGILFQHAISKKKNFLSKPFVLYKGKKVRSRSIYYMSKERTHEGRS